MKKFISSLVTATMIAMANGTADPDIGRMYPCVAVVTATDEATDTVTVKDDIGFEWTFQGVEDWRVGDGCNMLMYNNGTPEIIDDVIIQAIYYRWQW